MTGGNSELALAGLVLAILILVFAVVWFAFMLPMEKGLHKRRMELLQRRLRQNEQRLRREADERTSAHGEPATGARDDPQGACGGGEKNGSKKQASG
jgi:hypothetical protein